MADSAKMSSMTIRTRVRFVVLVAAVVLATGLAGGQQSAIPEAVRVATLDQVVPVDPLISVGTLPNGLRYYIRENHEPANRFLRRDYRKGWEV